MSSSHRFVLAVTLLSALAATPLPAQPRGQPPVQTQRADGVSMQIGPDWVSAPVVPEQLPLDVRTRPVIRPWQPGDPIREIPRRHPGDPALIGRNPPVNPVSPGLDPLAALQQAIGGGRAPDGGDFNTPIINQNSLPNTGVSPSDVNGDVGIDHYILSINGSGGAQYIIYNKSDGSVAAGPFNMEGLGTGNCAVGLGDAIILFDELANRWLLTEFNDLGNDLCVYVSSGSDPVTSTWSRYAFLPANSFPDYPKYGVWPDAYYVGTNQGTTTRPICAMDRARMLSGLSATMQCFTVPTLAGFSFQMLQPLDHDGADAPPAGANGTFIRHRDDEAHNAGSNNPAQDFVELWELDINWATPAASTRIGPITIPIGEFSSDLNGLTAFQAFPQPNGVRLDPLREPVMFRAAYRNLGTHEALVGNMVTDVDGADTGGIRWFELRRSGGTGNPWTLFQEGTYALADGGSPADRWMGAIAMDSSGNLALGYSITRQSAPIPAGLRYVGRLAGDPPGVMTTSENLVVNGAGSQGGTNTRWGDYHSMSIDPVDGCTFWFAGNYINASNVWATRLASFRHADCGTPDFVLNANNLDQEVCAVGPSTPLAPVSVDIGVRNGFSNAVTLSFGGGLPAGFSGAYTVNPVTPPGTTVANLAVASGTPAGAHAVTLRGSAAAAEDKDLLLNVQVSTINPTVPAQLAPADGATNVAYRPVFSWSAVPQALRYVLEVATDAGFTNIVASATVVGTSHQFDANLASNTTHYWRVRAQNGCATSANSGTRSFTTLPTPDQCPVGSTATQVFFDNMEGGANGWAVSPSTGPATRRWSQVTSRSFSPTTSWEANDYDNVADMLLTSPSIALPAGGSALTLQFQHYKDIEEDAAGSICYDGGRLEISVGAGAFTPIPEAQILADPYTNAVDSGFANPLAGERAWCGDAPFTLAVVDLSPYAGNSVRIRYRFGTDNSNTELPVDGWFVDDVKVQNCSAPANPTTTVLAATPDPSDFGQQVALTATVSSGAGTPTGNVQFLDGAAVLGTVALNGAGVATLNVSSLGVGAHTLNAQYAGGGGFGASSDSEPHTVEKADTTTTITSDNPEPSVVGQAVAVNYTVVALAPGAGTPSGNVVVTVSGGAETCTGTVAAGTCNLTLTSVGAPRVLTATYAGDANFNGSSDVENHTVNKANTTTTITSDNPDPSVVGQAVTVNYSVVAAAPGAGTPSGNVVVTVSGGAETCTGTVAAGTCNITLTSAGARTLTATYSGDASFNGSSDTEAHQVNGASATTTITSDLPDPSVVGQSVTVNYSVTSGAGTPTGNVVVTVSGGTETCTGTVAAGTCNLTLTGAGARTLTAAYSGDANFNGSSDVEDHTVNAAATTITITEDTPDPSVFGQAFNVRYTVVANAPGAGTPTGNVLVTVSGGPETCSSTVAAGTCVLVLNGPGPRTITASYFTDGNFAASSDTEAHQVNPAPTTTAIVSDEPDPSSVGQPVTVTFSVLSDFGQPVGNVVVSASGGSETCTGAAPLGSCQITLNAAGTRTLTATYQGSSNHAVSSGDTVHTVQQVADLAVTKTNNRVGVPVGAVIEYVITASNLGPNAVSGATLTDDPPAALADVSWTCTPTPPAACPVASGSGAINQAIDLGAGQQLTYRMTATVVGSVLSDVNNAAFIAAPAGVVDPVAANNGANDIDLILPQVLLQNGFE